VDAFREAIRDTFLGVSQPPVRADDVRRKQFSTHRLGYDKTEVEAFVEAAGLRLAAMESTDRPAGALVSGAILAGWAEWADSRRLTAHSLAAEVAGGCHRRGADRSTARVALRLCARILGGCVSLRTPRPSDTLGGSPVDDGR
jgi:DivIVA domain-containing protein